ncbi:SDR family oxidoreductase [Bradyrhizobium diazoefficiens]|uniref:SDR family oxidoreductase n=1 Tax=Bradyrhizobium diazoefficiens TaxID=1355477 RepID=UPI001B8C9548|nr:SDR family NAD(P)-dependent oxidoreductase [Bradyrhizobium diazoefficiens]MBR0865887.1 SDR family oxidoreductase [Bradyrhizobium diazoefficiens]MBR0890417.1 SDR family oxidoreductase [Bradyrhizobium diazoefficiens]MBR0922187.1 SDR family oxidoreductase [Bradyrhizobium diazoefficiens]
MPSAKSAVVTGATGAIGSAICRRLARDGYFVYACGHANAAAAASLVDELRFAGADGQALCFDIAEAKATEKNLAQVLEDPREIGAIVHAAGIVRRSLSLQTSVADWESTVAVNLNGFFFLIRPLLRRMIRARDGSIVALSSVVAERGLEGQGAYSASKAGLTGAVRSLAREIGPHNIRANIIAPGWIKAGMNQSDPPKQVLDRIPLRRSGQPDDVASLVSFLCSPDATYISGAIIPVSGGLDV